MRANVQQLRERWNRLGHAIAPKALRDEIFDQLLASYTASDRHYHGIDHIDQCLREFDGVKRLASDPVALELAIWFHDVIYDGRRHDNEQRSAEFADNSLRRMAASESLRTQVRRLILLTCHDTAPPTLDGQLMVDIDLASLGIGAEAFDENGLAIRQEYAHVSEAEFQRVRARLLGQFLSRPRIYYTDIFHERYERQARENLERVTSVN